MNLTGDKLHSRLERSFLFLRRHINLLSKRKKKVAPSPITLTLLEKIQMVQQKRPRLLPPLARMLPPLPTPPSPIAQPRMLPPLPTPPSPIAQPQPQMWPPMPLAPLMLPPSAPSSPPSSPFSPHSRLRPDRIYSYDQYNADVTGTGVTHIPFLKNG